MQRYLCETELQRDEIQAGARDGTLKFWRVDIHGRRWFKGAPTIFGVPKVDAAPAELDSEGALEADDDESNAERALRLYRQLVEARADGQDIDPDVGNEVLAAAGRSMADFEHDVSAVMEYGADDD